MPAGNYQWIRLDIDAANSYIITSTGAKFPLNMPSGSESGLKLMRGFAVGASSIADFMIDFDLRQSVTQDNSGGVTTYTLKPSMRLSDLQQTGSISGTVSPSLSIGGTLITDTTCSPAVYVYQGADAKPLGYTNPIGVLWVLGSKTPFTSATVSLDATSGNYTYTVGFLDPGTYTLAATCAATDGKQIDPPSLLPFSATQNVTVTAGSTSTIDF